MGACVPVRLIAAEVNMAIILRKTEFIHSPPEDHGLETEHQRRSSGQIVPSSAPLYVKAVNTQLTAADTCGGEVT